MGDRYHIPYPPISSELASLTFQSIAVGHRFKFHANSVGDGDDGSSLECESGQHRTEFMHFDAWILKFAGAFHGLKTSRIRFCAFSYSMGEPC